VISGFPDSNIQKTPSNRIRYTSTSTSRLVEVRDEENNRDDDIENNAQRVVVVITDVQEPMPLRLSPKLRENAQIG
jgi:hypothetical protein